jgi:outer membrane lipoprotein-sorting protein
MKKLIIPILLSLIFLTPSFAQTVDEILTEYFSVIGQEKLLATNTFTTKGKIVQQQFEIPFITYNKRPMNFRLEAEFQGMKIISGFDGKTGWSINPMMGSSDPQPMTEEQIDQMKIQSDYDGMFYDYANKGYKIEFTGKDKFDDIDVYLLKLTRPNGDIITTYMDAENYVILKSTAKMQVQGVDTETEMIFSNYKSVDGILIPFSMETKMNGQTVMQMVSDEIIYNVDIPDSMFEIPQVSAPADSNGSK